MQGVLMTLQPWERHASLVTQTDGDGRYEFRHIPAGAYYVTARHDGFVSQTHGLPLAIISATSSEGLIELGPRQLREDINFSLLRSGTISGRIIDSERRPLSKALVSFSQVLPDGTTRQESRWALRTDLDGGYLMANLPPGHYKVGASWDDPDLRTKGVSIRAQRRYFPGTTDESEAGTVRVGAGLTNSGIDIVLAREVLAGLEGSIVRERHDSRVEAVLFDDRSSTPISVESDGTFRTPRVKAGRYTLTVRATAPDVVEAAAMTFDLQSELTGLNVSLAPTATLAGVVTTDDGTQLPRGLRIAAVLADGEREVDHYRRDWIEVDASGRFELPHQFGDRVIRTIGTTDGWRVSRVMLGSTPVDFITMAPGVDTRNVSWVLTRLRSR